jgi:hypothetical protein
MSAAFADELVYRVQRTDRRVPGIGLQLPRRVGDHRHDLDADLVGGIVEEDGVAVALGHLAPVRARHARALLGDECLRLHEVALAVGPGKGAVEAPHDLARQLEMRRLVLAHGHEVGAHDGDVGGLQQGVEEEAHVAEVLVGDLLALLLVGRHALEPRHRGDHREVHGQLGDLGDVRLAIDGALVGVEAGRDPVEDLLFGEAPDLRSVGPHRGHRVPVGHEVERVVLLLEREHVLQVAEPVPQMELPGRPVAGERALACGHVGPLGRAQRRCAARGRAQRINDTATSRPAGPV